MKERVERLKRAVRACLQFQLLGDRSRRVSVNPKPAGLTERKKREVGWGKGGGQTDISKVQQADPTTTCIRSFLRRTLGSATQIRCVWGFEAKERGTILFLYKL